MARIIFTCTSANRTCPCSQHVAERWTHRLTIAEGVGVVHSHRAARRGYTHDCVVCGETIVFDGGLGAWRHAS